MCPIASTATPDEARENDGYPDLLTAIQDSFAVKGPLYSTDAGPLLWDAFYHNIPDEAQKHYECRACRYFIETYGHLARVLEDGTLESAVWDAEVPEFFQPAVYALNQAVVTAKITGVFYASDAVYGHPDTGGWHHLAVYPLDTQIHAPVLQTASQMMAEKAQDLQMLIAALKDYSRDAVGQAVNLLDSDALYRSEKVLGVAKWLLFLMDELANDPQHYTNRLWQAVATAPAGFCHVRSTMIGTLLDDIKDGLPFEEVSAKFASKMKPDLYQRPQADPPAGQVMQAEKIVQKLGAEDSLKRRFARIEELQLIWAPQAPAETGGPATSAPGVFSGVQTKKKNKSAVNPIESPEQDITWAKFYANVIPVALEISYLVESRKANFGAILTAENPDAPIIFQWNNHFSGYVYTDGSNPGHWGLSTGYVRVNAACYQPYMWQAEPPANQSKGVFFILEGAKDNRYQSAGNAIFPETLKKEFHPIRATIEAFSKKAVIGGFDQATACGVFFVDTQKAWPVRLRVTTKNGTALYRLDRWE